MCVALSYVSYIKLKKNRIILIGFRRATFVLAARPLHTFSRQILNQVKCDSLKWTKSFVAEAQLIKLRFLDQIFHFLVNKNIFVFLNMLNVEFALENTASKFNE